MHKKITPPPGGFTKGKTGELEVEFDDDLKKYFVTSVHFTKCKLDWFKGDLRDFSADHRKAKLTVQAEYDKPTPVPTSATGLAGFIGRLMGLIFGHPTPRPKLPFDVSTGDLTLNLSNGATPVPITEPNVTVTDP